MEKIDCPVPSICTATNPGMVNPADQTFPPVSQDSGTPSTAPLVQSNGEMQWARSLPVTAPPSPQGLPVNVDAASQSFVMPSLPVIAERLPNAVNVSADTTRGGGLPKNVLIR